jgi:cytochrome c oxidase subunit 2
VVLIILGVGIHITTYVTIPWIKWDLSRDEISVVREFKITMSDHRFNLPQRPLVIKKGDMVQFDVTSTDLMYGFGLFRKDGTMVFQMQVNPLSRNDIVWKFDKTASYTIRSTEYSRPKGASMQVKNGVIIIE